MEYLDAHPMLIGGVVLLLSSNQVEDAALLQVSQQLQVTGFLQNTSRVLGHSPWKKSIVLKAHFEVCSHFAALIFLLVLHMKLK